MNKKPYRSRFSSSKVKTQKKGVLFRGLPNNSMAYVSLGTSQTPITKFPGSIVLTEKMVSSLKRNSKTHWHNPSKQFPRSHWIINYLADPDIYEIPLRALAKNLDGNKVPVFNHPSAVLNSRRDIVCSRLAGIQNLVSPRCARFLPKHPYDFQDVFESNSFEFPILVRPAGSHTGQNLVIIKNSSEWDKIFSIPWGGKYLYMTQWTNFQCQSGDWRKLRLSITPYGVRLRHILYGEQWQVHSALRTSETVEREMVILKTANKWPQLQALGKDIRERMGLDFFGVDLGWKGEEEFVLFEANASMSILSYHNMPQHRREDYVANLKAIERDVWATLEDSTIERLR